MPPRFLKPLLVILTVTYILWTYLIINANIVCLSKKGFKNCLLEITQLLLALSVHLMIVQYLRLLDRLNELI